MILAADDDPDSYCLKLLQFCYHLFTMAKWCHTTIHLYYLALWVDDKCLGVKIPSRPNILAPRRRKPQWFHLLGRSERKS